MMERRGSTQHESFCLGRRPFEMRAVTISGNTTAFFATDGDGDADMAITFSNGAVLTAVDFQFVDPGV